MKYVFYWVIFVYFHRLCQSQFFFHISSNEIIKYHNKKIPLIEQQFNINKYFLIFNKK